MRKRKEREGKRHKRLQQDPLVKKMLEDLTNQLAAMQGRSNRHFRKSAYWETCYRKCVEHNTDLNNKIAELNEKLARTVRSHVDSHLKGNLAAVWKHLHVEKKCRHPTFLALIRALYNFDCLLGKVVGDYMKRAVSLLNKWMTEGGGHNSKRVVAICEDTHLVLTGCGPELWYKEDNRLRDTRKVAGVHYTQQFANIFAEELLRSGGVVSQAYNQVCKHWRSQGCEVELLATLRSQTMSGLAADIMESNAVEEYRLELVQEQFDMQQLRSLAVDATYKASLKVDGYGPNHKHSYVTVVGHHGDGVAESSGVRQLGHGIPQVSSDIKASFAEAHWNWIGLDTPLLQHRWLQKEAPQEDYI